MHYSKLIDKISDTISFAQQDLDLIKSFFKLKSVIKGTSVIEIGKFTDEVFFVNSGYLKYSKIIDSGEELIIHLFAPNNFATSLNSFFLVLLSDFKICLIGQTFSIFSIASIYISFSCLMSALHVLICPLYSLFVTKKMSHG